MVVVGGDMPSLLVYIDVVDMGVIGREVPSLSVHWDYRALAVLSQSNGQGTDS